ncbi:DUF493 domain-containing protein [Lentisphaerota bacterium WC36G]|nr:DUF493 domain-containing protein [Lentisphaerae bacterium WC36]
MKTDTVKGEIQFPIDWHYRIITDAKSDTVIDDIKKVLALHGVNQELKAGKESKNGNYQTFSVKVVFNSQDELRTLSDALNAIKDVKFLL